MRFHFIKSDASVYRGCGPRVIISREWCYLYITFGYHRFAIEVDL